MSKYFLLIAYKNSTEQILLKSGNVYGKGELIIMGDRLLNNGLIESYQLVVEDGPTMTLDSVL